MITEKLDGGNCCMFSGKVFARTHKHEATHASFGTPTSIIIIVIDRPSHHYCLIEIGPIKQLYVKMRDEELLLPTDSHLALFGTTLDQFVCQSVCGAQTKCGIIDKQIGETMCAQHSIAYDGLTSYFYLFAVFDTRARTWLAWQVRTQVFC